MPCHIVHPSPVQRIGPELRNVFSLQFSGRGFSRMWTVFRANGMNQCAFIHGNQSSRMTRTKENELQTGKWTSNDHMNCDGDEISRASEREREGFCHFRQNDLSELNDFNSSQSLLISAFNHSHVIRITRLRRLAERNENDWLYSLVYGNSDGSPNYALLLLLRCNGYVDVWRLFAFHGDAAVDAIMCAQVIHWICTLNIWIMFVYLRVYAVRERQAKDNTAYQPMPSHNKFTPKIQAKMRLQVFFCVWR